MRDACCLGGRATERVVRVGGPRPVVLAWASLGARAMWRRGARGVCDGHTYIYVYINHRPRIRGRVGIFIIYALVSVHLSVYVSCLLCVPYAVSVIIHVRIILCATRVNPAGRGGAQAG